MNTKVKLSKSKHELDMKKIAQKMASYFESHFTVKDLILWQMEAADLCSTYAENVKDSTGCSFLSSMRYTFLDDLLDAKTATERKTSLEKNLPFFFDGMLYENSKEALAEIGSAYLANYVKYRGWDDEKALTKFMSIFTAYMYLTELYDDYHLCEKELWKEKDQMKKAA